MCRLRLVLFSGLMIRMRVMAVMPGSSVTRDRKQRTKYTHKDSYLLHDLVFEFEGLFFARQK